MATVPENQHPDLKPDWIGESFQIYKRDIVVWSLAALICNLPAVAGAAFDAGYAVLFLPYIILRDLPAPSGSGGLTANLLPFLRWPLESFLYAGLFMMANRAVRGEKLKLTYLFSASRRFAVFMLFTAFSYVSSLVGAMCCCVPGIALWSFLLPSPSMLADGVGFGSAMQDSFTASTSDAVYCVFVGALFYIFAIAAVMTLGFTSLITLPMTAIISALMCRDLPNALNRLGIKQSPTDDPIIAESWPPIPKTKTPDDPPQSPDDRTSAS
jgi:hypothetical protein